jgi:hypothetical protein
MLVHATVDLYWQLLLCGNLQNMHHAFLHDQRNHRLVCPVLYVQAN